MRFTFVKPTAETDSNDRHDYMPEKLAAIDKWEAWLVDNVISKTNHKNWKR